VAVAGSVLVRSGRRANRVVEITTGEALINPPGVVRTADSKNGGWIVTITPGLDTQHRPR